MALFGDNTNGKIMPSSSYDFCSGNCISWNNLPVAISIVFGEFDLLPLVMDVCVYVKLYI
ncbi:hypothetical protein Hanom_Chr09g00867321 [Helianthus anomalus]